MATIEVSKKDLEKLVGKRLTLSNDELFDMKLELDREEGDSLFIELEYDRADLLSAEGIARQMRGYYGIETGLKKYELGKSASTVTISEEMKKYRPYAQYFVALNVPFSDASVRQIMQIQEKLHYVYAKDRELASVGVYDYDKTSKNFVYEPIEPQKVKFVPLETNREMSGREILEEHPKGPPYACLLQHLDKYPLLSDDKGRVLSMPPIINSEDTKVDEKTKNLFVDVTGTDASVVNKITVVLATMLAERGAKIQTVAVKHGKELRHVPQLEYREKRFNPDYARRLLGVNISNDEMIRLLKKQRFDARLEQGQMHVIVPCYRFDVMHDVDIIEEIACAYGLNNMKPVLPNVATIGEAHKIEKKAAKARSLLTGMGFQEIATFILSSKETFEKAGGEKPAELANAQSEEYNCVRNSLIPKLIEFAQKNKHYELPQKFFECGEILAVTNKGEQKTETIKHVAAAITSADAGFTEIKSVCEALLRNMRVSAEYRETDDARFVRGRCAEIHRGDKKMGIIGEVNPDVLTAFGLENPMAAFEVNVEKLL
ncbi:MAG: phenylalanine--tRNA ligase subunit beta [archaeon]